MASSTLGVVRFFFAGGTLFWILLTSWVASAQDLVFTDLHISADSGLTLSYAISPASWAKSQSERRMGRIPSFKVQVRSGATDRTNYVEIKEMSRTLTLDSGSWPKGLTATVAADARTSPYRSIQAAGKSGSSISISVSGGAASSGADPYKQAGSESSSSSSSSSSRSWSSSSSSSDPSSSSSSSSSYSSSGGQDVSPEEALAMIDQAFQAPPPPEPDPAILAAQLEAQRLWLEQQAKMRGVANDPNHPLSAACHVAFDNKGDHWDCVRVGYFRGDAVAEISACSQLDKKGHRYDCLESLKKRGYNAGSLLQSCVEGFGTDDGGIRCINATMELRQFPSGEEISACRDAFEDDGLAGSCVRRLDQMDWPAAELLDTCAARFANEKSRISCQAYASKASSPPVAVIEACAVEFDDEKSALECVLRLVRAPEDGAEAVRPCKSMFDKDAQRFECLERSTFGPDRSAERLQACADEPSTAKQLRCVEGN